MAALANERWERQLVKHAGEIIAIQREKLGLLQRHLVKMFGVSQSTVSNWESTGAIPVGRIEEIASQLKLDPEVLRTTTTSVSKNREESLADTIKSRYATDTGRQDQWRTFVLTDGSLSAASRSALALLPSKFLARERSAECFVTKHELVEVLPDVTAENVDAVWDEMLSSGYVEYLNERRRVLLLSFPLRLMDDDEDDNR